MNIVEKLREYQTTCERINKSTKFKNITDIIYNRKPKGYTVKGVLNRYQPSGTWSSYDIWVYEVECGGKHAYFELYKEIPAVNTQYLHERNDFVFGFYEVIPKSVVSIEYIKKV